jgi:hypothetical protein
VIGKSCVTFALKAGVWFLQHVDQHWGRCAEPTVSFGIRPRRVLLFNALAVSID